MNRNEPAAPHPDLALSAVLGDLARPVFHDCNDFLNNLLLHLALMEEHLPEAGRDDLRRVQEKAKDAAAIVREWQRFRKPEPSPVEVDFRAVVAECVGEVRLDHAAWGDLIALKSPGESIVVHGSGGLRRLVYVVIRLAVEACANQSAAPRVDIIVDQFNNAARLTIDDNRALSESNLRNESGRSLEAIACQSLAQRCGAALHTERSTRNGMRSTLSLPLAR